uniref:Uncharacterized protein n=1 Tax=Parascaris univalens TaxID=6257 RepID=A0A915B3F9_PARUN
TEGTGGRRAKQSLTRLHTELLRSHNCTLPSGQEGAFARIGAQLSRWSWVSLRQKLGQLRPVSSKRVIRGHEPVRCLFVVK